MYEKLKQAFTISLPICFRYVFLGIAFALLMSQEGFPAWASIFQESICLCWFHAICLVSFMNRDRILDDCLNDFIY